jgi:hypothetical protein
MAVFSGISADNCPKGRAGINALWAANCSDVQELTFDADRNITAITMDATQANPIFHKFTFERDTAFFSQEKTRIKQNINVVQTISIIEPVMRNEIRNTLEDVNDACCLHIIVRDNTGQYHYAGISYDATEDEWRSEFMTTGDGSGNTGADPTSDNNEYVETFSSTAAWYAPFVLGGEAIIPITEAECCDDPNRLTTISGDCLNDLSGECLVGI